MLFQAQGGQSQEIRTVVPHAMLFFEVQKFIQEYLQEGLTLQENILAKEMEQCIVQCGTLVQCGTKWKKCERK